jgi:hypothetical protein
MIDPEVTLKNLPHAQSPPSNRRINWAYENNFSNRRCKA